MSAFRLLLLAALGAALLTAAPSAARTSHEPSSGPAIGDHLDRSQALAASGVVVLGIVSLAGISLLSRRQRGYLQRR